MMIHMTKRMTAVAAVLAVVLTALPFTVVSAADGDFSYTVLDDGTAAITQYNGSDAVVTIPATIDGYTVTAIGEKAFFWREDITEIILPDSVTTLQYGAFLECGALDTIVLPDGITDISDMAFQGCRKLTSVTLGDKVERIGDSAFLGCSSLETLLLPESVTEIAEYAFWNCGALKSMVIPDNVTQLGSSAFEGCSALESVTLGASVASIGRCAFFCCESLVSITIPDSVESIGYGAFEDCESLGEVALGNGVTTIDIRAFSSCAALEAVTIPASVTSVGYGAFGWCNSLEAVAVSPDNTHYISVDGVLFTKDQKTLVQYPAGKTATAYIVPDGVEKIIERAFYGCQNLTEVTTPANVKTIQTQAFAYCENLTALTIGDGFSTIESDTFRCCRKLETVTLPASIAVIFNGAFEHCDSLAVVIYGGRKSEWECTQIFSGNEALKSARVITIDDMPTTFEYTVLDDGTAAITQYNGSDAVVTIPATIDGYAVTEIGSDAFYHCDIPQSVTIPDSVKTIRGSAFAYCQNLTEIVIPEGVTSIGNNAFYHCSALQSAALPASVTTIGDGIFSGCTALKTITLSPDNQRFTVADNVLFTVDMTTLLQYPIGCPDTAYAVPDGVKTIAFGAFEECQSLQSVILPDGAQVIGDSAFYGCSQLQSVTVPDSLMLIDGGAFAFCSQLDTVYYAGCEREWDDVEIGPNNSPLANAQIVCATVKFYDDFDYYITLKNTVKIMRYTGDKAAVIVPPTIEGLSVTAIGAAFDEQQSVNVLVLPSTLDTIEATAFEGGSLTHIFFAGTKTQWKAVCAELAIEEAVCHYEVTQEALTCETDDTHCFEWGDKRYNCAICGETVAADDDVVAPVGHHVFYRAACQYCGENAATAAGSAHPYPNSADETTCIINEGAQMLRVTFSSDTYVEKDYDFIYIYDKNDTLVGTYTGDQLAGKVITVDGDTVKVRLVSDNNENGYGYAIESVVPLSRELGDIDGNAAVDMRDVMTTYVAFSKGHTLTEVQRDLADFDGNGVLNIRDVMAFYKQLAKG